MGSAPDFPDGIVFVIGAGLSGGDPIRPSALLALAEDYQPAEPAETIRREFSRF
jgi:hypothetical protein